jgi:hypothetical protein
MIPNALRVRGVRAIFAISALFALALAASTASATPDFRSSADGKAGVACDANTGSVQQLAKIFNTRDRNFQCLGVKVDGNALRGLRIENHKLVGTEAAPVENVSVDEFPVAEIESRHGAVLDGTKGHDAVIVQGSVSPADGDVELVTRYLYNGLTGEYRSCRVKLDHSAPAWRLINQFNETVSRIVVKTRNVPVLGTIGIAALEGACTPVRS